MWELLKNKNNPPKIEKIEQKKDFKEPAQKADIEEDNTHIFEALRKSKEMTEKKVVTEKVNFAGISYE